MSNNFNMSFDPDIRKQFTEIVGEYGLTAPQAFKLFANQVVKTRTIPLSFDFLAPQRLPSEKLLKAIAELEKGETTTYENLDDFIQAFNEKN